MPKRHGFTFDAAELREMAEQVLARAKSGGASGCDCEVSEAYGLTVTVSPYASDTSQSQPHAPARLARASTCSAMSRSSAVSNLKPWRFGMGALS